jgi:SAM-dependent methyltransferase
MRSAPNPFTDPSLVRGALYRSANRIARRTSALHRARVSGTHAAEVIADLVAQVPGARTGIVADLGCGRGTTTRQLAGRIPGAAVIGVDLSAALLTAAKLRLPGTGRLALIRADFGHLPFSDGFCAVAVAAFCLYHAPSPASVIAEIARCLVTDGTAIVAVKSADSYRELDHLIARTGLDPNAERRPSLYQTAHSDNIESLAAPSLDVRAIIHEPHRFVFPTLADAAEYLSTSPKYALPPDLADNPAALAAALRQRTTDEPVTASSVVTYLSGTKAAR